MSNSGVLLENGRPIGGIGVKGIKGTLEDGYRPKVVVGKGGGTGPPPPETPIDWDNMLVADAANERVVEGTGHNEGGSTKLLSSVIAPASANNLPPIVAPVAVVMEMAAKISPRNNEPVAKVAEEPICHPICNEQAGVKPLYVIDDSVAVVRLEPI